MTTTRAGDQVIIKVAGDEIAYVLDAEIILGVLETDVIDCGEELLGFGSSSHHPEVTITLHLNLAAPPGKSDQEVYRWENGVPLV